MKKTCESEYKKREGEGKSEEIKEKEKKGKREKTHLFFHFKHYSTL